jgi:hypothetical protein
VVSKFAWFSTLYRQVQILAGHGVHLDRSTLAGWVKRTAWWLKGLYELQLRTIHAAPLFFCDETRMPVLDPGRGRTKTCQFWAHAVDDRPWGGPSPPAVAYVFADGRGKGEIAAQLIDYAGILRGRLDQSGSPSVWPTRGASSCGQCVQHFIFYLVRPDPKAAHGPPYGLADFSFFSMRLN